MEKKDIMVSEELIEKWIPIIEGKGDWKHFVSACPKVNEKQYGMMAQLFENVEKQEELSEAGTTTSTGVGDYKPILIPMLRRIMPSLIGPQIFGTQPMTGPTGLVFALRAVLQNDSVNALTRATSVILTLADATGFTAGTDIVQGGTSTGDGNGVVRHVEGNNVLVEVQSGTFVAGAGEQVDDADPYVSAATTISAVYENEALFQMIFSNYSGTHATATGEALSTDMKEVGFEIETGSVTAKTRKLKAKWTHELEEDLRAVHAMDAESLLQSIASDEITLEMNQEFISLVASNVGATVAWDYSTADGRWELEKYQNLCGTISRAKRAIASANKRGQATFMIVSPAVLSVLETSGKLSTDGVDPIQTAYAGDAIGMKVFVDNWASDNSIYLGYKGPSEVDAGIFYCPYVPVQIRKGMGEETGQPVSFFATRYATSSNLYGASLYYRKITCANLPT